MRRALNIAGFLAIAAACLLLWPQRWGGTMTYDITRGTSMQPTFHTGDLAILRQASSYRVGDIAAYHSPTLHTTVMHRIKTASNGRYTFKGDNNNFVDPDTVTDKEMLGRLLFQVPKVGRLLTWFVQPLHLALAIGALFLLFSDRKQPAPRTPAPEVGPTTMGRVRITSLSLPAGVATAEVADAAELEQLAAAYRRPVLVDDDTGATYLLESGVLFRHVEAASVRRGDRTRARTPQGRDWAYGLRIVS